MSSCDAHSAIVGSLEGQGCIGEHWAVGLTTNIRSVEGLSCPTNAATANPPMSEGIALMSTLVGEPDFTSGEVVTLSEGGPGRLVAVMKCTECGWSYRLLSGAECAG